MGRPSIYNRQFVEHSVTADTRQWVGPDTGSHVTIDLNSPSGIRICTRVDLLTMRPNYGGTRRYFACPKCGQKAQKLFSTQNKPELACRKCHDLVYFVQHRKGPKFAFARSIRTGKMNSGFAALGKLAGTDVLPAPVSEKQIVLPVVQTAWSQRIDALTETQRSELTAALSLSDSGNAARFLSALFNPRYQTWNVFQLARRFKISLAQLNKMWQRYHLEMAMVKVAGEMPKLAQRLVEDAIGSEVVCPRCNGIGRIAGRDGDEGDSWFCTNCKGKGVIIQPGNEQARDLLLEIVGLGKRSGPANVVVNANIRPVESVLEELARQN